MKKILLIVFMFSFFVLPKINAQITGPVIRANFGVDADLRSNYFNGAASAGNDDWFSNGGLGAGQYIIDTTGAAAILAAYISNPATRMLSFSRLMRQAPYSVVNNRLLLDAVFNRDFHGDDSTVFASGSNKNGMSPASWTCPISQGIPDKNDILDVYAHARRAGPNILDSLWFFGGVSIENTTGNRYFDFELYQSDFYYNRPTRTFQNYGPDAGHTSWVLNPDGTIRTPGDIIFTAEYGSSSLTLVEARIWVHQSSLSITPAFFNWGGLFDGGGPGAVYGYASILPKTAGAFYTGLQSGNGVWTGPFQCVTQNNSLITSYIARQFMEFSVNMTKLGLDPAYISSNGCSSPFRRVVVKTRASTSFTAELKDFVAPFRMFNYAYPQAVAELPIFCGDIGVSDITVINPMPTSTYTWTTTDGNIVGSTTGPSITVDTTGTYTVTQQLHIQCPAFAVDDVTIVLDEGCLVLDKNLVEFSGVLNKNLASLYWRVNQNEQINSFAVEYSLDRNNFELLSIINPDGEPGVATYSATHDLTNINAGIIYYRLRLTGRDGRVAYSHIVAVRIKGEMKTGLLIYPNPSVSEKIFASVTSVRKTDAEYIVTDMNSKIISRKKITLYAGNNTIALPELDNSQPGAYFIKMITDGNTFVQKIIVSK